MKEMSGLPPQQLSMKRKNKLWRKKNVDFADNKTIVNEVVRNSVIKKRINYDLLNGKLHMSDLELILNPEGIQAGYIPDQIQHYPIINSKLNVLRGEESRRIFDYKVVVTNPTSISEIENNKKEELFARLQQAIANTAQSEEEFNAELEKINEYFTYEWQDARELRGNYLLNHYSKELNFGKTFNEGFMDAMTVGEEIYQCDIVGGEPTLTRLNPQKVRVLMSGYSNRIEDADMIIIEDYWNPGKIIDTFYDVLTEKDMKYIEEMPSMTGESDNMDIRDERQGFVLSSMVGDVFPQGDYFFSDFNNGNIESLLPYDFAGNIRVLQVYWKSRRKIKRVKSYDPETGEEIYNFYDEQYVTRTELGEEEEIYYINEAWEGTKIGKDIYVNMRPRPVQYNRLSNPSRCHFGIIGSIYNTNESKPFTLVDMMKPYSYAYDVIHDRLNKLIAHNWGKLIQLDLAKVPKGWNIDKWMYYAKTNNLVVVDSFKEGNVGAAMGKLAGALNNASNGVIDAELGQSIITLTNLLEFIKLEMSEVAGISKQREGQISNRETVGGVERATLQSSHITEWLFVLHDDVKKRVLEAFLETAKIALKGRSKKFNYILSDYTSKIVEIDGDEFAECDYGLVVDNSNASQELNNKLDMLAQAALQNQTISFSTIMKLYTSTSLAEKQRMVENDERALQERQAQAQQQEMQMQQQQMEMNAQMEQAKMELEDQLNARDNETKILVASMSKMGNETPEQPEYSQESKDKLAEQIREFDARLALDKERLNFDKDKARVDAELKRKQINKKPASK